MHSIIYNYILFSLIQGEFFFFGGGGGGGGRGGGGGGGRGGCCVCMHVICSERRGWGED